MEVFAARLRYLRRRRKLTQRQLAERVGLTAGAIGMYETGQRQPDLETVQRLAHALDTSISYLVGETDDPTPLPHGGIAAHREGADPGDPLDPEVQLAVERVVREVLRRQQEESRGGSATRSHRSP